MLIFMVIGAFWPLRQRKNRPNRPKMQKIDDIFATDVRTRFFIDFYGFLTPFQSTGRNPEGHFFDTFSDLFGGRPPTSILDGFRLHF